MATLKDIAARSGVSVSAVSRILNHDATLGVPAETRQRVFDTARELGYQKPARKNKKKTKRKASFTMGILQWFSAQEELADNYYLQIRQGIEDFCVKNDIEIRRAFRTDADYMKNIQNVNGLICIGKFSKTEAETLVSQCRNIIFLDMNIDDPEITTITLDFDQAVKDAIAFFEEYGHDRIAYIGGREYTSDGAEVYDERRAAYVSDRQEKGLYQEDYLQEGSYSSASGYEMMKRLLPDENHEQSKLSDENHEQSKLRGENYDQNHLPENIPSPTAVFCASDQIAFGAMKAIVDSGRKVPEDISVIGFDDVDMCAFSSPALTTLHAPAYDMGQHGANILYAASNLSIHTPMKIRIPCRLVARESVAGNSQS
ncbi:MAG: LacI family DNA-binding transcriptional regulator [Eubacterium sp.]|nr:LacI family DNA-binding transcriptional regulator [Eubacterium sp.]